MSLPYGTKVRTLYEHSETGIILKPRKHQLPLPSPQWNILKFDIDGLMVCIHDEMVAISNE